MSTMLFGAEEPFAEPYWYRGMASPYYKPTHVAWRSKVRTFMDDEVLPFIAEWEEQGEVPIALLQLAAANGLYGFQWPQKYGGTPPEGLDAFHECECVVF
eukprot:TRINITY_DN12869_c0_g1_i4.p2 TRINITY_DN12869_c0_g1~~TRINITY_DN12869_c0_g1_i4.p2  ORF type:complete len:100 (+),score=28.83 TRINITY_DN12869_c0_g1_i4:196-495(+)